MLSDDELIERLRLGLSVLQPRADLIEELHRAADRADRADRFRRIRTRGGYRRLGTGLALALGVLVVVLVAGAALTLSGRRAGNTRTAAGSAAGADLSGLERAFPFLLRPQTAADRAATPDNSQIGQIVSRRPTVIVLTKLVALPRLTRLVTSQGITVRVFVARLVVARVDPASASSTGPVRRFEASLPPYELAGQLPGQSGPQLVYARVHAPGQVMLTAYPASGHRIFSLVPADVTDVHWAWPRARNATAPNGTGARTVTAHVHDNLAISVAPETTTPRLAEWYDGAGHIVRRLTAPDPMRG